MVLSPRHLVYENFPFLLVQKLENYISITLQENSKRAPLVIISIYTRLQGAPSIAHEYVVCPVGKRTRSSVFHTVHCLPLQICVEEMKQVSTRTGPGFTRMSLHY